MRRFSMRIDGRRAVLAVLVVNLLALAAHAGLRHRVDSLTQVAAGRRLTTPSGIARDGRTISGADYAERKCHVVRYESTRCPHCATDRGRFASLVQAGARRGCSMTVVAPSPDQFFDDAAPAVVELAYPSVEASRTLPAYGTPTTLVARSDWTVLWSKRGALEESDVEEAFGGL